MSLCHTLPPEYVQTGPYNRAYTESQLEAGGGFILPDFNEEQVIFRHTATHLVRSIIQTRVSRHVKSDYIGLHQKSLI